MSEVNSIYTYHPCQESQHVFDISCKWRTESSRYNYRAIGWTV